MNILKLLKLDDDSLKDKQVNRYAKSLKREQTSLINKLSTAIDTIDEEIEKHEELDATLDPTKWVEDMQKLSTDRELAVKKLEIAKNNEKKYFTSISE